MVTSARLSVLLVLLVGSMIQGSNSAYLLTLEECYHVDDALLPKDECPLNWIDFFEANSWTSLTVEEPNSTETGLFVYDPLQALQVTDALVDNEVGFVAKFFKKFCLKGYLAEVFNKKESILLFILSALVTFSTGVMLVAPVFVLLVVYQMILDRRRLLLKMNVAIQDEAEHQIDENLKFDEQIEKEIAEQDVDEIKEYQLSDEVMEAKRLICEEAADAIRRMYEEDPSKRKQRRRDTKTESNA